MSRWKLIAKWLYVCRKVAQRKLVKFAKLARYELVFKFPTCALRWIAITFFFHSNTNFDSRETLYFSQPRRTDHITLTRLWSSRKRDINEKISFAFCENKFYFTTYNKIRCNLFASIAHIPTETRPINIRRQCLSSDLGIPTV